MSMTVSLNALKKFLKSIDYWNVYHTSSYTIYRNYSVQLSKFKECYIYDKKALIADNV